MLAFGFNVIIRIKQLSVKKTGYNTIPFNLKSCGAYNKTYCRYFFNTKKKNE